MAKMSKNEVIYRLTLLLRQYENQANLTTRENAFVEPLREAIRAYELLPQLVAALESTLEYIDEQNIHDVLKKAKELSE